MPSRTFQTLSDGLQDLANVAADHFETYNFKVKVEAVDNDRLYPSTPALIGLRSPRTIIVEVDSVVRMAKLDAWLCYARTRKRDTRIILVLPAGTTLSAADDVRLKKLGIGVYMGSDTPGDGLIQRFDARDATIDVQLPELKMLPPKLRKLLAPVYEKRDRGDWIDCFQDACEIVENEARSYFVKRMQSGAIKVITATGKDVTPTLADAQRATLGKLADYFPMIQSAKQDEVWIGQQLKKINKDRIEVTHRKQNPATESRLRKNIQSHMWTIYKALEILVKYR